MLFFLFLRRRDGNSLHFKECSGTLKWGLNICLMYNQVFSSCVIVWNDGIVIYCFKNQTEPSKHTVEKVTHIGMVSYKYHSPT